METLSLSQRNKDRNRGAWLARSAQHLTPGLRVMNSSPTLGTEIKKKKTKDKIRYITCVRGYRLRNRMFVVPFEKSVGDEMPLPIHQKSYNVEDWTPV